MLKSTERRTRTQREGQRRRAGLKGHTHVDVVVVIYQSLNEAEEMHLGRALQPCIEFHGFIRKRAKQLARYACCARFAADHGPAMWRGR